MANRERDNHIQKRNRCQVKTPVLNAAFCLVACLSSALCLLPSSVLFAQYSRSYSRSDPDSSPHPDAANTSALYSPGSDSIHPLSPVTITAFQGRGDGADIAASVFPLTPAQLQFIDNSSLISSFNMTPGVRLEQRSPGSLRLSVRGSLLRSPYGVRGIKFYIDGIPLTDAGGNTYLQSLAPEQIQSAEIIKGPAGSLYGAGTGGAVLLHSPGGFTDTTSNQLRLSYTTGSFGRN